MNKRKVDIFTVVSALFLFIFIPVLFCIFVWGNRMNYNLANKLSTLYDNKVLLLIAIPVLFMFFGFIYLTRSVQMTKKLSISMHVCLVGIFILVFFVNLEICKCINIAQGWDVGVVVGTAYNLSKDISIGSENYYSLYPNNVPITFVLSKLFVFADSIEGFPYVNDFMWNIVICIMISVAGYMTCISVKKITQNFAITIIACVLYIACVCFSPWKTVPYTDMFSIMFPMMCICFYILQYYCKSKWSKYGLWFGIFMAGFLGSLIKPTVLIIPIAIFLCEMVGWISSFKQRWKEALIKSVIVLIAFFLYQGCKTYIYSDVGYEPIKECEFTALHFMMMGLNEESTGSFHSGDVAISGNVPLLKDRTNEQLEVIKERLEEKGFAGYMYFLLRKMVMTFNSGTFGWAREGVYTYDVYPIYSDAWYVSVIRDIFMPDAQYSGLFNTYSQGIWLLIIFCIPGMCFVEKEKREVCMPILVAILGTIFYLMLFEARARYLLFALPVFVLAGALGIGQYYKGVLKLKVRLMMRKFD